MTPRWLGAFVLMLLTGCGSTVATPPTADGGTDLGPADAPAPLDRPIAVDVPLATDVPTTTDEGPCSILCPQPPSGCRYVGPVECRPGGCGTLVCVDAGAVMCGGSSPASFPSFARACTRDVECFAAEHQTDCCGNVGVVGLNVSAMLAFAEAEMTCRSQYPGCGCPARPPTDEDGRGSTTGSFGAQCASGLCRSFAR